MLETMCRDYYVGIIDTVGSYTITYTATDRAILTATRVVNVVDTTSPTITVTGDNPMTIWVVRLLILVPPQMLRQRCRDYYYWYIDSDTVGSYNYIYCYGQFSNTSTATRVVNVVTTSPTTQLLG